MPAHATRRQAARPNTARRSAGTSKSASSKPASMQEEIDRELRAWVRRHGKAGAMPSRGELIRSGFPQLASRIHHHGGTAAIARRLGLTAGTRSQGRATARRR